MSFPDAYRDRKPTCLDNQKVCSNEINQYLQGHHNSSGRGRRKQQNRKLTTDSGGTEQKLDEGDSSEMTRGSCAPPSGKSNLESFLEYTTPTVQCQYLSKRSIQDASCNTWKFTHKDLLPHFILGDLWDAFDEWSAYGAGVPLFLSGGENVVQYYVPYLSALQIYARDCCNHSPEHKRLGDESDCSDIDLRDASSESSIDTENSNLGTACTDCPKAIKRTYETADGHLGWDTSTLDSDERSTEGLIRQRKDRRGQLVFEYFERSSPYGRAPLAEKISELACHFPKLRLLQSNELSAASWFSVAWYPIYRIPTGPTMRDLATCFLTFHSLSVSSLQEHGNQPESNECGSKKDFDHTSRVERPLVMDSQLPFPVSFKVEVKKIALPAFGMASYKLRGALWVSSGQTERTRVFSLASCASSWLKQLDVQHPDFEFFASHGAFTRR